MRVLLGLVAVLTAAACAGLASARAGESGTVSQFAPRSSTTWWAVVDDNTLVPRLDPVYRTLDGGRTWTRF